MNICVLAIFLFILTPIFSKPPYNQMCDFNEAFVTSKNPRLHLSPTQGQYAIESSLIKNLYWYGDRDCPIVKTIRKFFYAPNLQELDVSILKPFCNFKPAIIAILVAALENNTLKVEKRGLVLEQLKKKGISPSATIKDLLRLLERSYENEQQFYPPHMTQMILVAFLYQKADSKKDLVTYVTELGKVIDHNLIAYIPKKNWDTNDEALYKVWRTIPILSDQEYEEFPLHVEDIDRITYGFLSSNHKDKNYPPELRWLRKVPYFQFKPIPDCFETLLRIICNHICYDGTQLKFDSNKLPLTSPARAFYQKYTQASYTNINSLSAHYDWLLLTVNLPGASYKRKGYELWPTKNNLIISLHYLLHGIVHNAHEEIDFFPSLKKLLIVPGLSATIGTYAQPHNAEESLTLTFNHSSGQQQLLTLFLTPEHAWAAQHTWPNSLKILKKIAYDKCYTCEERFIQDMILQKTIPKNLSSVAFLYGPLYRIKQIPATSFGHMVLFSFPTPTEKFCYYLSKRLLEAGSTQLNRPLINAALKVVSSLNDSNLKQQTLRAFIDRKLFELQKVMQEIAKQWPSLELWDQQRLIVALAANNAFKEDLYKSLCISFLNNNIPTEKNSLFDNKVTLLKALLHYNGDHYPEIKEALKHLFEKLPLETQHRLLLVDHRMCRFKN